jgi:hypothetical protein
MKRRNIEDLIGKQLPDSKLTILKYAGKDTQRYALVRCRCECGNKVRITPRLCDVLAKPGRKPHTISCGCVKHERYVAHIQRAVDKFSADLKRQCFIAVVDKSAPKPNLPADQMNAGYYRWKEELEHLPDDTMLEVRRRVLARDSYPAIAQDTGLHPAEVAWLAKHVIRPEIKRLREEQAIQLSLKADALSNIAWAKKTRWNERQELREEQKRGFNKWEWSRRYIAWSRYQQLVEDRFSASELRTPGTIVSRKAILDRNSLDFSWDWMKNNAPHMELSPREQKLLNWFRKAGDRTFEWRRDDRRRRALQQRAEKQIGKGLATAA